MNMSKEKWNDVRKILRDDRLEFDVKCNNNVFCIICKKVLADAHNAACGCRYCLDCITNYLNGEDKICPGNTDECKAELLNLTHNIHIDHPMNREILKIIIKCPENNCEFKDEVRNIVDHMRICDSRSIDCPYLNMGCKESKIVNTGMKNHLMMEIVSHTQMLFELIDNLKNEIRMLKNDKVELKKDKEDLKKLINDSEIKNENERREIKEKLKKIENKLVEEHENVNEMKNEMKNEIKLLKDATDSMKTNALENKRRTDDLQLKYDNENRERKEKLKETENKLIEEQKKNVNELKKEIKMAKDATDSMKTNALENKRRTDDLQLKYDNENRERKEKLKKIENKLIEEQKKNVDELKKEIKLVKDETESIKRDASQNKRENETKIDEINKTVIDLKSISNKSDELISNLENKMRVLEKKQEQQIGGEFMWRIDKWKKKMEQARAGNNTNIYSDAFYSNRNGYKMCLNVYPNGNKDDKGTNLSVFFCLMRGEFDDILSWPFKHVVTIELINQHTTQIHTSYTVKYDDEANSKAFQNDSDSNSFRKPISDRNIGYGFFKFISLTELSNNLSLIDNDQIFIRCRVKID